MIKKCNHPDCPAPKGLCREYISNEHHRCEHWQASNETVLSQGKQKGLFALPWQGRAFEPGDIALVSSRSSPLIIGMIGTPEAGKTSYLSMLFRLLLNGWRFDGWRFAGSYTLSAWESLAQYMVLHKQGKIVFPPPTPSNPDFYSLYHLSLRQGKDFKDIFFADSSGEVFKLWSIDTNDSGAENARWIYANASAFILFVDCEALVQYRARAVQDIRQMAEQLAVGLLDRPVVIVWSKSDRIGDIPPVIRQTLQEDLESILGFTNIFEISNFPGPRHDTAHYKNNLAVVPAVLSLVQGKRIVLPQLPPVKLPKPDFFINYRGTHEPCK